jgi:hypothetical protein
MNEQVTPLAATGTVGQPWNPPWIGTDATKLATLTNLRNAYPKSTPYGASITPEMAFAMVRGQAGFNPAPVFGVDVEADGLAFVRFNWGLL